jgi:hypothetical protein
MSYSGAAMKNLSALILFVVLSLASVTMAHAQTAETLWLQSNSAAYKTRETVTVTINAISATPIQGFTAQIRYDPACLQPEKGTSPIPGMNGLAVPQEAGLADVSFASTTPQMAHGLLAELQFTALKGCQTSLKLESAALVIRNESGFATPVTGVNIDQNAVLLNIDSAVGNPQPEVSGASESDASVLPLAPTVFPEKKPINWRLAGWLALAGVVVTFIIGLYKFMGSSTELQRTIRR